MSENEPKDPSDTPDITDSPESIESQESPPTDFNFDESVVKSSWPKVFGIISLIYATIGLICALGITGSPWISEWGARLGGMSLEFPSSLKIVTLISGVINFVLGLILFFGAINLLRRRASGVKMLKIWAVSRILFLVLGFATTILMAPQQIDFQRQVVEFQNDQLRQAGREDRIVDFSDDELWTKTMINTSVFSVLIAIYPIVVGFYFARKKIDEEVLDWHAMEFV